MKQCVRTTVAIPSCLYRKLKAQSAAEGRSVCELILRGVKAALAKGERPGLRPRLRSVKFPLIVSPGPTVDLTNEEIYEGAKFP